MRIRKEIDAKNIAQILETCGLPSKFDVISLARSSELQMLTISAANQVFFLKCSFDQIAKEMLQAEFEGLSALRNAQVSVPGHLNYGELGHWSWLFMDYISNVVPDQVTEEEGGRQLALVHQISSTHFGWETDNFIGSLVQSNNINESWWEFFCEERLSYQLGLAVNKLSSQLRNRVERIINDGVNVFPDEKPTLCHGDLWHGNQLYSSNGKSYLIDPAVYFGHREMDLGMTKLFGGFGEHFYGSYELSYPLEQDWKKRVPITTLYPILVHVNLFGEDYLHLLEEAIQLTEKEVL